MNDRIQEALRASQLEVIAVAEKRLGRKLTAKERAGIEHIGSLLMLESTYRSFTFPGYSVAQVESDIRHFASQSE